MRQTAICSLWWLAAAFLPSIAHSAIDLEQGWSRKQERGWLYTSQGSRLIPLSWALALEQPGSDASFMSPAYLASFRYEAVQHPDGFLAPRGFVPDRTPDNYLPAQQLHWRSNQRSGEPWLGLTCSACHTRTISYRGESILVYGGPTLADFQSFLEAFDAALIQTDKDPAKFARFAAKVIPSKTLAQDTGLLKVALEQYIEGRRRIDELNATTARYGFGRLDAVGQILNRVALYSGAETPTPNPPNAPVSYPFLWNISQHTRVQWNGMAKNGRINDHGLDVGALARNTGEVVGVFADVDTADAGILHSYATSVDADGIAGLEVLVSRLKPPKWPSALFGAIDPIRSRRGKELYGTMCADCHRVLQHDDLSTQGIDKMIPLHQLASPRIDTDIWMACNAFTRTSDSGRFYGLPKLSEKGNIGKVDRLANMLPILIKGALIGKGKDVSKLAVFGFFGIEAEPNPFDEDLFSMAILRSTTGVVISGLPFARRRDVKHECETSDAGNPDTILAYKARPLNGIWATAPYLHNGSVATLFELTQPPANRRRVFYTGSNEFDPVNVGFRSDASTDNTFLMDVSLPGNSNEGHDYGVSGLSDEDRWALVEYMKTL